MYDKIKVSIKKILPIIVLILSLGTINNVVTQYIMFDVLNYFAFIVSIFGLIGSYLYFKHNKPVGHWIELWIITQIPYVDRIIFATATKNQYHDPFFDASQIIKSCLYLVLYFQDSKILIGFNYLPLIFIGVLLYFKVPYLKNHYWIE